MTAEQIEYRNYLKSWRWQLISKSRRWWDMRCRACGETKRLQVHHSSYLHRGKSFAKEWLDTITLCNECHSRIHSQRSIKEFAD